MNPYCVSHLSNAALDRELAAHIARDRENLAELLALLGEFEERRLYAPAAYPSMYKYCVLHLHFSEEVAYKRIQAARAARRFPALLPAVADGRLHLTAVVLLAPHLTPENAGELLEEAAGKTRAQIEALLAQRFPRPDLAPMVRAIPNQSAAVRDELDPDPVAAPAATPAQPAPSFAAPSRVDSADSGSTQLDPDPVAPRPAALPSFVPPPPPRVAPLAPQRYGLQFTVAQSTYERLCRVQELLGRSTPQSGLPEVFDQALELLERQLQRRKFAATDRPRETGARPRRPSRNPRHIPARVKRAVWRRDGGQCSFVSESGQRCSAREGLEYDHSEPVARGGEPTVNTIRLRCRAHNQYEAECAFGAGFMHEKREAARAAARQRASRLSAGPVPAAAPGAPPAPALPPPS